MPEDGLEQLRNHKVVHGWNDDWQTTARGVSLQLLIVDNALYACAAVF